MSARKPSSSVPGAKSAPRPSRAAAGEAVAGEAPPRRARPVKPVGRAIAYTPAEIHAIFARFRAADPEPQTELDYLNPFTLLVAVVLSAQATDAGVNRATRDLFPIADTPEKMLALGEDRVREAIRTIGLYRTKAHNVIALSRQLVEKHGGAVPDDREALEALPGVGRKTANVVLNVVFGHPTLAVDTHIFRLGNRLGLAPGSTPDKVEAGFLKIIPPEFLRHAHHWLILHGRHVCKAGRPLCERCDIADLCRSPENTSPRRPGGEPA
ncbi:endonuclease III [Segnochrobactraceae bacterium EtOH-i3]